MSPGGILFDFLFFLLVLAAFLLNLHLCSQILAVLPQFFFIFTGPDEILLKFPITLTVPGGIKLKFSLYSVVLAVFFLNLHLCSRFLAVIHKFASIYYNNNSQQLYLSFEP